MAPAGSSGSLAAAESGDGMRGLLISLLTIFDVNKTGTLSHEEYSDAAGPLGFDTSDEAWHALVLKFGEKNANERPSTADGIDESQVLDMQLIGAYFSNKYDPLLEEILRRLIRGIISTNKRSAQLEHRLKVVEDHLEVTSMREMREREMKIKKTLRFWTNRITAPVFDGWKKLVAEQKHTLQKTLRHMLNRTLSNVFRRWVEMIQEIKDARNAGQRAVARWRLKFVTLCFDAWVQDTKDSIEHREQVMKRAANSWSNSAVFGAFTTWHDFTQQQHKLKDLQRRIVIRMSYGVVFDCFNAWAGYCGEETEKRMAQLRQAAMKIAYSCLVQTFAGWVEFVKLEYVERAEREARALNMAMRMMQPYVVWCFEALQTHCERAKAVKRKAAHAIGPGRLLHMVIRTWAHNVREQVKQRERDWVQGLIAEAIPRLIDQSMNTGVADKVGASERQQQAAMQAMQDEVSRLQAQVDLLQAEIDEAQKRRVKEREQVAQKVLRQWRSAHVSRAFSAWCEAVEASKGLLRKAAGHWKDLPLKHALEEWSGFASYGKHLQTCGQTIAARASRRLGTAVVSEWRRVVRAAMHTRNRGNLRALNMWKSRQLAFFYPWKDFAKRSKQVKAMGARCLHRLKYASIYAAFTAWAGNASEAAAERHDMLKRAVQRFYNRSLVLTFQAWAEEYRGAKAEKQRLYALAVRRFINKAAAAAFDAWMEFVERKKFILKRASYYLGDGLMISHCFSSWRALHARAQKIKQTEWLLQDLKLVGTKWLVETLDTLIPGSLPHGSGLRSSVARALDVTPGASLQASVSASPASARPGESIGDGLELAAALQPQPPIAPRMQPAAPGRPGAAAAAGGPPPPRSSLSDRSASPAAADDDDDDGFGPRRGSAPSPELSPEGTAAGDEFLGALELPPPLPPIGAPVPSASFAAPPPPLGGSAAGGGAAAGLLLGVVADADVHADPPGTAMTHASGSSLLGGGSGSSAALHALGAYLEGQQRRSDWAVRRVYEMLEESRASSKADAERLSSEMRELHRLQLEHASLSLADATKRQSDANHLDDQVAKLASRLKEVDEQCFFLKDTLYSLLTVGAGKDGMPKTQAIAASKKPLKPLKAALTAPWSSVTPGQGF